jgi:hypothetical protein
MTAQTVAQAKKLMPNRINIDTFCASNPTRDIFFTLEAII